VRERTEIYSTTESAFSCGFAYTSAPLAIAVVMSTSNPASNGTSPSAAPCTIMGFTELKASGTIPRDFGAPPNLIRAMPGRGPHWPWRTNAHHLIASETKDVTSVLHIAGRRVLIASPFLADMKIGLKSGG
jgi:hypothetical protein